MMETKWFRAEADGRVLCELCPRACRMKDGDRGFCFVRKNEGGRMVLDTYGKSTGFCIDPIEKKPLNHFLPGTPVLSFGTAGCNLGCKFCQNWDISKSREVARLSDHAMPADIAAAAERTGCRSVAFTYNDPVIWAEYAIDTAHACHERGIKTVAVTAGYMTEQSRGEFYGVMDAANIDLKAFEEDFYFKLTGSHLGPVLDTIRYACNETDCWVELTNLIIPDANDSPDEIERMCTWVLDNIGPNVPIHFTAFHPDFRMNDRPRTSHETLVMAYDVARRCGLNYVYVGNVHDVARQSTYCHSCGGLLVQRDWHQLGTYALTRDRCGHCDAEIPGVYEDRPGTWGARRQPVKINPQQVATIRAPAKPERKEEEAKPMATLELTELEEDQKQTIHRAASAMIQAAVQGQNLQGATAMLGELVDAPIHGVFVTAKRGETLRGCCGRQGESMKLGEAIADSAARTTRDPRMPPLSATELPFLDVSVSLLGDRRPIGVSGDAREQAIQIGTHGLRIQMGQNAGLLLPQVAIEQGWNARQFLDAVCRKAGLPAGTWRSDQAAIEIFDGVHFGSGMQIDDDGTPSAPLLSDAELAALRDWVHRNVIALQTGATPMYYATGVSDLEVLGLVLSVSHPSGAAQQWLQLGIKDGRPMQSSLFQMTEQAARWLGRQVAAAECQVDVAVMKHCVHHGGAAEADVRGVNGQERAVLVTDGRRWAVQFDQNRDPAESVSAAMSMERFREGEQFYSLQCSCTADKLAVSVGPRADSRVTVRPAAVAGTFYAGSDAAREAEVDRLVSGLPECEQSRAFAIMVPHAGLRFSGRVAADVWRRVDVPSRVIIIGPKHTADGVDWAIAPHTEWRMTESASVSGDIDLVNELAEAIPGLEIDSRAHAREHGIEIQLPIMKRFCPDVKLAAIVMSGASVEQVESTAEALATWMESQADPPLLVVSSDMNHYADDEENRRRDRMALDALATGDGAALLDVCDAENISMCGQIPAALALMTMKKLGKKIDANEIAYATSADYGGDKNRVVGYAGVIWEE